MQMRVCFLKQKFFGYPGAEAKVHDRGRGVEEAHGPNGGWVGSKQLLHTGREMAGPLLFCTPIPIDLFRLF